MTDQTAGKPEAHDPSADAKGDATDQGVSATDPAEGAGDEPGRDDGSPEPA